MCHVSKEPEAKASQNREFYLNETQAVVVR